MAFSRTAWLAALLGVQSAALVGSFFLPGLGTELWHHLASLAVVLAAAVACRRLWASRRFLGLGALATAALATVSGFYLLYWKEGIRVDGYQDWGVFWHVAWSWAAAVFFWQHTWVNRVAYGHFCRRSLRGVVPATAHLGSYALATAAFVVTAGAGKAWFDRETYIPISLWIWLIVVAAAYAVWLLRPAWGAPGKPSRAGLDLALVPVSAVAILSGLPLLLVGGALDAAGLQYASKFWHVGPSILFSVLVFAHSALLWGAVRRYWQRAGQPSVRIQERPRPAGLTPKRR